MVAIIVAGLRCWRRRPSPARADARRRRVRSRPDFLLAVGAGLFAFGGWHMVTYTAEETVDPDAHDPARR